MNECVVCYEPIKKYGDTRMYTCIMFRVCCKNNKDKKTIVSYVSEAI